MRMRIQLIKLSFWKAQWPWIFLLVVAMVGYWPISFGLFSIKNDAIHYFLPFRYNISSALRNGELPFWSPYIYLGYPLNGDMQSGAWNPFVWIISLFGKYNLTLFHIEYLLYIFLAGAGMFKLSGWVTNNPFIRVFAATAYMLSGYIFGSGQFINWIASAAFIPFAIYFYYQFILSASRSSALLTAIFCWLLLVCGYPADTIYTAYILLAMLILGIWYKRKYLHDKSYAKKLARNHLLMVALFLGLAAPALISFWELLPYYSRGTGASYEQSIQNAYDLKNTVSFLNPWPTLSHDFKSRTDFTGKNIFTGVCVVAFFLISLFYKWDKLTKCLLLLMLFSFLFSLGNGFGIHKLTYDLVPGMNNFRHPSHFRLYVILPMIILAARGFSLLIKSERSSRFSYLLIGLLVACLVFVIYSYTPHITKVFTEFPALKRSQLKQWISLFNKNVLLFAGFVLQTFFLSLLFFLSRRKNLPVRMIVLLHLGNLLVFQALFPVNFVSKTNPSVINKLINEAEASYDASIYHRTLLANSSDAFQHFKDIGLSYFYSNKIGISKINNSPSFLSDLNSFLRNDSLYELIANRPVAYLTDDSTHLTGKINTIAISHNQIKLEAESTVNAHLNLSQNYHHNWEAEINGDPVEIDKTNIAFMSVHVKPGRHIVKWIYSPTYVYAGLIIFCVTLFYLAVAYLRILLKSHR